MRSRVPHRRVRSASRPGRLPKFDRLEDRRLMAIGISEVALPNLAYGALTAVAAAKDGSVWFTEGVTAYGNGTNGVFRLDSSDNPLRMDVASPLSYPSLLSQGPDGNMWAASFDDSTHSYLLTKFDNGHETSYPLPAQPLALTNGPDGKLWMTSDNGGILRLDPSTGAVAAFPIPTYGLLYSRAYGITAGPDGNLWFTASYAIGRITPAGVVTEFPVQDEAATAIVTGPDGALWFGGRVPDGLAQSGEGVIGRITTDGAITLDPLGPNTIVSGLAVGPDKALWFLDTGRSQVGRLAADWAITFYPAANSVLSGLEPDGQGGLIFADTWNGVGRVTFGLAESGVTVTPLSVNGTEGPVPAGLDVARFTSPDPSATAGDFQARVDLGEARPMDGTIRADGKGGFLVSASTGTRLAAGPVLMTVTVTDLKHGHVIGANATAVGVETFADAPISATGADFTAWTGTPVNPVTAHFTDPGGGNVSEFSASTIDWGDGTPASTSTVAQEWYGNTYTLSGSHTYTQAGTFTVTATVKDAEGSTSVATSHVVVTDPSPLFPVPIVAGVNQMYPGVPVAILPGPDAGAQASDFTATIDWGNGTTTNGSVTGEGDFGFVVYGNSNYASSGTWTVLVTVKENRSGQPWRTLKTQATSVAQDLDLYDDAPVFGPESRQGYATTGPIATFTLTDSDFGPAASYAATVDWGDGYPAQTVTVEHEFDYQSTDNASPPQTHTNRVFDVTGSHIYTDVGLHIAKLTVTPHGRTATTSYFVVATSPAPQQLTARDVTIAPGWPSRVLVATFQPSRPGDTVADYGSAASHFDNPDTGEGYRTYPTQITADPAGGFDVWATIEFDASGSYPVRVDAWKIGEGGASVTSTVLVAPAPPLPAVTISPQLAGFSQGTGSRGRFATFTSTDPNAKATAFQARVSWNDGPGASAASHTIDAEVTADASGGFDVWATAAFADWGEIPVTVNVYQAGTGLATASEPVLVTPAIVTATASSVATTAGVPVSGPAATFRSSNALATVKNYAATIDEGDGSTVDAVIVADPKGGFDVVPKVAHAYARPGTYTVHTTILSVNAAGSRDTAATVSAQATVTSAAVALTPRAIPATEAQTLSGPIASFVPANTLATAAMFTASIVWGDGTASAGTVQADPNGGFDVVGDHTYARGGQYSVAVAIHTVGTDAKVVAPSTTTSTVTVAPADATATFMPFAATEGKPFSGPLVSFVSDDDKATAAMFTASIDWGDGTTSAGTVQVDPEGGFDVLGAHTYARGGLQHLGVTIHEVGADGSQPVVATSQFDTRVAYQPITASGVAFSATTGQNARNIVARFSEGNAQAMPADFSARIHWGDGTQDSFGEIDADGSGGFVVWGFHMYTSAGSPNVTVTISLSGEDVSQVDPVTVTVAATVTPPPPTVIPPVTPPVPTPAPPTPTPAPVTTPPPVTPSGPSATPAVQSPPPTVIAESVVLDRKGHAQFLLSYSAAIDAVAAASLSRYRVTTAGRDGKFGTKDDKVLKLASGRYDASAHKVTLVTKGVFARKTAFHVAIQGGGVFAMSAAKKKIAS